MSIKGSCLCKGIQYEITAPIGPVANCHCSMCRKSTGTAFLTGSMVKAGDLRWTKGEDLIARYESSPGGMRWFCKKCGSTLGGGPADPKAQEFWISFGTLDDDPGVKAQSHIYVGSKAPWHKITDKLPQFKEFPG